MTKMETACLRIKFTPLLQNIQKDDSKHSLEIVPEISCIQNLDKIQWRKDENSIEYTIPMTYKIILRKKHVTIDTKELLDKTYHSCVDLLLPSSDTNFMTMGSGDISRIVSDTFVLSKVTTDVEKCSIILKDSGIENKSNESTGLMTAQVQTERISILNFADQLPYHERMERTNNYESRETAVTQTAPEVFQSESHVTQVPKAVFADFIKNSMDKITNTDTSSVEVKTASLEEFVQVSTINSKTETKRNLSLTPICSINTDDDQTQTVKRIASNTIVYLRYETQKEFASAEIVGNTVKSDDLYFSVYKRYHNSNIKTSMQYNCVTSYKIQPEVRVANFVQIMEKEIMPLKLMLSDIITKCSTLGFSWKKSPHSNLIYKNVPNCEKQMSRCLKTKNQTNSNRVVYSVVFDG